MVLTDFFDIFVKTDCKFMQNVDIVDSSRKIIEKLSSL